MKIYSTCLTLVILIFVGSVELLAQNNQILEVGNAVYYADYLHGKKTASGELYDKNAFTCAHKTLAYGTILKVTRLDNGKSVNVRVNDRGPFGEGLVVDISRAAASQIGLLRDGKTRVSIEMAGFSNTNPVASNKTNPVTPYYRRQSYLPGSYNTYGQRITQSNDASKSNALRNINRVFSDNNRVAKSYDYSRFDTPTPNTTSKQGISTPRSYGTDTFTAKGGNSLAAYSNAFVVQVGAFSDAFNASRRANALKGEGLDNVFVVTKKSGTKTLNKVVVGPYNSKDAAASALTNMKRRYGLSGYVTTQ